ncbi:unnamed protein product [Caenorhabditis brenneri]
MSILSISFFSVEILALILSGMQFYLVVRNRNNIFIASFYRLYKIDSIGNLLTWLNAVYLLRLSTIVSPTSPFSFLYLGSGEQLPRISQSLSYFFAYVQYSMTAVIAMNRWSVMVLNPAKYEKIWLSTRALFTIAVILLVPMFDAGRFFWYKTTTTFDEEAQQFVFSSEMTLRNQFAFLIFYMPISTAIGLIMNILCFVRYSKLRSLLSNQSQRRDGHLAATSLATCSVQLCGCILSIIRYFGEDRLAESGLLAILPYVSSVLTWFQSVMLFVLSGNMRKEMKKLVLCQKEPTIMVNPANIH